MKKDIRVLIVEDEFLVSTMIKETLEEAGYTVIGEAATGLQAVEMTNSSRPDVILMDLQIPNGDGIEATRKIHESCPTPVVVLTAHQTPELVEQASAAGVGAYLVKPPNIYEIERAITIAMARFEDMMELRRLNTELQEALDHVKVLRGILPICASCKKIRDDEGYWQDVAVYIRDHSEAEFSHGLCPDCMKELYPDFYQESAAVVEPSSSSADRLPISPKETGGKRDEEETPIAGSGRVLAMEEDEFVRDMLSQMLSHIGYEVETASNSAEAMASYQRATDAGQPFDVVILDIGVPGDMRGKRAIKKLLEIDPDAKAVVSSGYAADPIVVNFKRYGFSGVLIKPYSIRALSQAVGRAMMGKGE